MVEQEDNRNRQILLGVGLVVAVAVAVCGTLYGWRYLPGVLGEWVGTMIGMLTTPFILEASFVVLGFCLVFWLNHRRERREGSEWVMLERVDGPGAEKLPDHARWALLPDGAPDGELPGLIAEAEGAADLGDWEEVATCLQNLDVEELRRPDVMSLRERLARATGHDDLADRLVRETSLGVQKNIP